MVNYECVEMNGIFHIVENLTNSGQGRMVCNNCDMQGLEKKGNLVGNFLNASNSCHECSKKFFRLKGEFLDIDQDRSNMNYYKEIGEDAYWNIVFENNGNEDISGVHYVIWTSPEQRRYSYRGNDIFLAGEKRLLRAYSSDHNTGEEICLSSFTEIIDGVTLQCEFSRNGYTAALLTATWKKNGKKYCGLFRLDSALPNQQKWEYYYTEEVKETLEEREKREKEKSANRKN